MNEIEAFSRCRTPADFYRLQIQIENRYLPSEMAALIARKDQLPARLHDWLGTLARAMRIDGDMVEPFVRVAVDDHIWLLRGGGEQAARKSLLLAFCGNSMRLMMPLAVFAQRVPAARFDLVVLADPRKACYLRGVQGYADDLFGVVERLRSDLQVERYESIRCLGASAGSAAALCAARLLGAQRAIAVGGVHPSSFAERLAPMNLDGSEFDKVLARASADTVEMRCYFGADNARDREGAQLLLRMFPAAQAVPMPGIASHNLLFEMLNRNQLRGFLETAVLRERH